MSAMRLVAASQGDGEALAALRVDAMRESLERIGRFDPQRARDRFLSKFDPAFTRWIEADGARAGFVVVRPEGDALLLDHLYVMPGAQGAGLGARVLAVVFDEARAAGRDFRVGALRGSDANRFYARHGFELQEETEFDLYYRWRCNGALRMRPGRKEDFEAVLALNAASVRFLSPLDGERLAMLAAQAAVFDVAEWQGEVAGFLLALGVGARYDSPNYQWFAQRHDRFLYVDRVVVGDGARRHGLAAAFYRWLFAVAHLQGVPVACEFDVDPPNPASESFHARFGFREVGQQVLASGKRVSLQLAQS